jgi:UV DNA damage endonuclease
MIATRVPRLGFAVKVLGDGGIPSHDTRRHASDPHLSVSLDHLERVFGYLERTGIRMYRMSSNLAPYETHPDLPRFHGQVERCAARLAELGERARAMDLRLSTHPGQYTVLNSESPGVAAQAAAEVGWHARLLDAMGLGPEAVVVVHGGSGAPDPAAALDRFARAGEGLPDAVRRRLVLENDDRVFSLGMVEPVARRVGIPVVWDVHHHHCHDPDGIPDAEALGLAVATWPEGVRPKVHFSSPRTAAEEVTRKEGRRVVRSLRLPSPRSHADLVDPFDFRRFLDEVVAGREVDVMLEAKAKDLALLRLREQLADVAPALTPPTMGRPRRRRAGRTRCAGA